MTVPGCTNNPVFSTSSRTDAGVHALCNSGHVDLTNKYNKVYEPVSLRDWLNRYFKNCSHEIRILSCIPVMPDYHSRYNAAHRTYIYRLLVPKDNCEKTLPVNEIDRCYLLKSSNFDVDKARSVLHLFQGRRDYKTFTRILSNDTRIKFVRKLEQLTIEEGRPLLPEDPHATNFHYWNIVCSAKGFLYNQVRRIVASLIAVGQGLLTEKDVYVMLTVPSTSNWNTRASTAPSCGLFLTKVHYDPENLRKNTLSESLEAQFCLNREKKKKNISVS
ncbi:tRNA pseudouridine synthase-like 1 isoform X2 [Orussus abietinus]|nr:tRNA pseudouridine synthase-like 1 isoform X2 [Orussus abietinus]